MYLFILKKLELEPQNPKLRGKHFRNRGITFLNWILLSDEFVKAIAEMNVYLI